MDTEELRQEDPDEETRQSVRNIIPDMTLMDDYYLMLYAQRYPEDFAMFISTFLGEEIHLVMDSFRTQRVLLSADENKDVRFDVYVKTVDGGSVVLEVESSKKFHELRLRYYASKQDAESLPYSSDYKNLKPLTFLIVSKHDVGKRGKPRYFIRNCVLSDRDRISEDDSVYEDGKLAVFINAAYRNKEDRTELADLIHDFSCVRAKDIRTDIIREHTEEIKGKKGRMYLEEGIMEQAKSTPGFRTRLLTDDERREAREEGANNLLETLIVNALKLKNKPFQRAMLEQVMQIGNMTQKSCLDFIENVAKANGLKVPKNIFDSGR